MTESPLPVNPNLPTSRARFIALPGCISTIPQGLYQSAQRLFREAGLPWETAQQKHPLPSKGTTFRAANVSFGQLTRGGLGKPLETGEGCLNIREINHLPRIKRVYPGLNPPFHPFISIWRVLPVTSLFRDSRAIPKGLNHSARRWTMKSAYAGNMYQTINQP